MSVRLLLAVPLLMAGACVTVGADPSPTTTALAPTFESATSPPPAPETATTMSADPSAAPTTPDETAGTAGPGPPSPTEEPAQPSPTTDPSTTTPHVLAGTITDPVGDATARLGGSPDWADLAGGRLERRGAQMVLHVALAEAAPSAAPDGDTFNVASFYDLDGDGSIDVEVWANLSDGGWDTAEFDNRAGRAAYSDDDSVDVDVTSTGLLELVFPPTLLDSTARFRWALASEYGSYEELSTPLASRDDAPDDDRPAAFPDA